MLWSDDFNKLLSYVLLRNYLEEALGFCLVLSNGTTDDDQPAGFKVGENVNSYEIVSYSIEV